MLNGAHLSRGQVGFSGNWVDATQNAATQDESVAAVVLGEKDGKRRLVALFTVSDITSGGACPRNLRHEALSPL